MRFILKFSGNIYNLMRQAGYHPEGQSFAKCLGASDYPRFHIYLSVSPAFGEVSRETLRQGSGQAPRTGSGQAIEINLHLDQKKPSYEGAAAHSGEYEGELVEKEAERIKQILSQQGV